MEDATLIIDSKDAINNSTVTSPTSLQQESGGLSLSSVMIIVSAILIVLMILVVGGYFGQRKFREIRRNHGEYRPQFEEYHNAKDLPYLQPPAIQGLI